MYKKATVCVKQATTQQTNNTYGKSKVCLGFNVMYTDPHRGTTPHSLLIELWLFNAVV